MAKIRRRGKPYNPASQVHDRRAADRELVRGAQVAVMEVDDPLEVGSRLVVVRSFRDDPLERLHVRRQIDEAQYHGGRAFQFDFETAERGPRAIDPAKEWVDGGRLPEPITEAQRKSALKLKRVYAKLEQDGSALVHSVLVHGQTFKQVAEARGYTGRRWEEFFASFFQMCLHKLSYEYGFATEPTGKQRVQPRPNGGFAMRRG